MELVSYRQAKSSDLPYVYNSILKSMRADYPLMRTSHFFDLYKPKVQRLIADSKLLIACYKKDQDMIYGYVVYSKLDDILIVHWVNVKLPFRRMGLATEMLKQIGKAKEDPAFATAQCRIPEIQERHFFKLKPQLRGF